MRDRETAQYVQGRLRGRELTLDKLVRLANKWRADPSYGAAVWVLDAAIVELQRRKTT